MAMLNNQRVSYNYIHAYVCFLSFHGDWLDDRETGGFNLLGFFLVLLSELGKCSHQHQHPHHHHHHHCIIIHSIQHLNLCIPTIEVRS